MKTQFFSLLALSTLIFTSQARGDDEEITQTIFGSFDFNTGLTGNLYDLKNTPERDPTDVAPDGKVKYEGCYEAIEDLAKKGFRDKDLADYRIGDASCDLKTLAIKTLDAIALPAAFGSPEIDPTGIIVVYKGVIAEAPEKEIDSVAGLTMSCSFS